jgi:vancomycin aglycone glucosyltransferase
MRVLLSTYGSRGDVELLVAPAVRLREAGAEVRVCGPPDADQPYWAGWVAELGIGAAHDGPVPTTESLSVALKTALTAETAVRATAVGGVIRTDGAAVAARLLLEGSC